MRTCDRFCRIPAGEHPFGFSAGFRVIDHEYFHSLRWYGEREWTAAVSAAIGTLAMIREFESPQSGLLQVECVGTQRFRVRSNELQKHGLWVAEVEAVNDDVALEIPDDLRHTATALQRLIDTLEERRRAQGEAVRLPIGAPYQLNDCGWVANRWCELVPMQLELRQRLMELDSPLMRLELVSDLLARTGITE